MIEKLRPLKEKFEELTVQSVDPQIIADNSRWRQITKERSKLQEISDIYDALVQCDSEIREAKELLKQESDNDMKAFFENEIEENQAKYEDLCEKAKIELLPKDENDEGNVILELRAGAGGDEAGIFANDLLKMYMLYADKKRWKFEITDINETEVGGIKDATVLITGKQAFKNLKFESGVHRVQRVPDTESQGRIHTSTATVAVLPELKEVEFDMDEKDFRIDTYRASGAGGQHINKTDSAIRITHIPTNTVVACQDERSQIKNREKAWNIMKSKLYDLYQGAKEREYAQNRKIQIGSGDRAEKIRTYNYPQSRITDHRIAYTTHDLNGFMGGNIQEMIDEINIADQKLKLENWSVDNE